MKNFIASTNLITDLKFKQSVGMKADALDEALAVINQGLEKLGNSEENGGSNLAIAADARENYQINVKLFLRGFDPEAAVGAVNQTLEALGTDKIDSLIVCLPAEGTASLGIRKHTLDPESGLEAVEDTPDRLKVTKEMMLLWNELTKTFVTSGKVSNIGLCDLEPDIVFKLYAQAEIKPNNIQVNLKSCCVVPPELQDFAKEKGIKLTTHNDPPEILTPDFLSRIDKIKLAASEDKWLADPDWIIRYQLFIKARGVLHDKRYLIPIKFGE